MMMYRTKAGRPLTWSLSLGCVALTGLPSADDPGATAPLAVAAALAGTGAFPPEGPINGTAIATTAAITVTLTRVRHCVWRPACIVMGRRLLAPPHEGRSRLRAR